jgi:hypothetical protein
LASLLLLKSLVNDLATIKRLIIQGRYAFTEKALLEIDREQLTEELVLEAILNAQFLKIRRSTSARKSCRDESICMIESFTYAGLLLYTKGVVKRDAEGYRFYLLISSKKSL